MGAAVWLTNLMLVLVNATAVLLAMATAIVRLGVYVCPGVCVMLGVNDIVAVAVGITLAAGKPCI